jgi:hypothetical protein
MSAVAIASAAILIAGTTVSSLGSTIVQVSAKRQAYARSEQYEARFAAEAASAKAIFAPAVAVDGAANCTAGKCRELDLMAGTTTSTGQQAAFVAYLATTSGGVQRYTYSETAANAAPQGVIADGAPITGKSLYFRDVPVTSLAADPDTTPTTKAHLAALSLTPRRWTFQYEHAGVVASNDVFYVHYDPGTGVDVFPVSVRVKPLSNLTVNNGTYNPPTAPAIDYAGGSGKLVFNYPAAAAQAFTVHELRYHDAFSTSAPCAMSGTTIASASPSSQFPNPNPVNPPNQDSGPATFTVTSAQPGLCTQLIKDVYGQTLGESVQVMGPLTIANGALVFTTPTAPAQSDSVSKTYDNTAVQASSSGCGGIAAFGVTSQSAPASVSASPATTHFNVWPAGGAYGSCTMSISDQYGETVPLNVTVWQGLQLSPTSVTFPDHTQPSCQYPDNTLHNPCTISVSKWGYNAPATYGIDASQCSSGWPTYGEASSSAATINANGASASSFTISPILSAGNPCKMYVSDSVGEQATVSVQVNDPPCPGGQPRDANGNCPPPIVQVASGGGTMSLYAGCKKDRFGNYMPGMDTWKIYNPTVQSYGIDQNYPSYFVAITTMTLPTAKPVTFTATDPSAGITALAVSTAGTQMYTNTQPFTGAGTWSGNTWTPPYAGTFYVGYYQDWFQADCLANGTGSTGYGVYNGTFSFTATQ